jgi:tRNA uridine 5-carbamoylmethylation protein Kti12
MNKRQKKKALKKMDISMQQCINDMKKTAVYMDRCVERVFREFLENYKKIFILAD